MAEQYRFNPVTTGSNAVVGMMNAYKMGSDIAARKRQMSQTDRQIEQAEVRLGQSNRQLDQGDTRLSLAGEELGLAKKADIRDQGEYDYIKSERADIIAKEKAAKLEMDRTEDAKGPGGISIDMSDEDFNKILPHMTPKLIREISLGDKVLGDRLAKGYNEKQTNTLMEGFDKKEDAIVRLGNEWNLKSLDPRLGVGSQSYTAPQDKYVGGIGRGSFGSKQNVGPGLTGDELKLNTFTRGITKLPSSKRVDLILANTFTKEQISIMNQLYSTNPEEFNNRIDSMTQSGIKNNTFLNKSNNPEKIIKDAITSKFKIQDNSKIDEAATILKDHMDKVEKYKDGKVYKFNSSYVNKVKIDGDDTSIYKVSKSSAEQMFDSSISDNFKRRDESIKSATGHGYKEIYNSWKDRQVTRVELIKGIDDNKNLIDSLRKGTALSYLEVKQIMLALPNIESSGGKNNTNLSLFKNLKNGSEYMGLAVGPYGITVGNFSDGVKNKSKSYADLTTISGNANAGIQDFFEKYKTVKRNFPGLSKDELIEKAARRYGENTDDYANKFREQLGNIKGTLASASDIQDLRNMFT